eukprot:gene18726-24490_t
MTTEEVVLNEISIDKTQLESPEVEEDLSGLLDEPEDLIKQTLLNNKYSFWYHRRGHIKQNANYDESIIKVASCQTIEHFWKIYDHLVHPNEIKVSLDYHFFKDGIKPVWEDPNNKIGGKWMVRVKKGLSSHYWEELLLAIIGEQFDVGQEICGAVISIRQENDIISVWNKTSDNVEASNRIRDQIRKLLKLPLHVAIEYKKHQESLEDKTSFRNPSIVWRGSSNHSNNRGNDSNENRGQTNRPPGYQHRNQSYSQQSNQTFNQQNNQYSNAKSGDNISQSASTPAAPNQSKEQGKSRWDALKGDGQAPSPRAGWRSSNNTTWNNNTAVDNNGSSNQDNKGRNIGNWVKNQLIKGQTDTQDKPAETNTQTTAPNANTTNTSSNAWKKSTPATNPWNKGIKNTENKQTNSSK